MANGATIMEKMPKVPCLRQAEAESTQVRAARRSRTGSTASPFTSPTTTSCWWRCRGHFWSWPVYRLWTVGGSVYFWHPRVACDQRNGSQAKFGFRQRAHCAGGAARLGKVRQ